MKLFPAIDILEGRAVRLRQGDFDKSTLYNDSPLAAAAAWVEAGAEALHIVDLDGARSGTAVNFDDVREITAAFKLPIQLGGGLRSVDAVRQALDAGVTQVILGTAAINDSQLLDRLLAEYPESVTVSLDGRDGVVAVEGWERSGGVSVAEAAEELAQRGVRRFVYSDISRDGTLSGVDVEQIADFAQLVDVPFVYSGGVGRIEDLSAIGALAPANLEGVIVGTALYDGSFTIPEAQRALSAGAGNE